MPHASCTSLHSSHTLHGTFCRLARSRVDCERMHCPICARLRRGARLLGYPDVGHALHSGCTQYRKRPQAQIGCEPPLTFAGNGRTKYGYTEDAATFRWFASAHCSAPWCLSPSTWNTWQRRAHMTREPTAPRILRACTLQDSGALLSTELETRTLRERCRRGMSERARFSHYR